MSGLISIYIEMGYILLTTFAMYLPCLILDLGALFAISRPMRNALSFYLLIPVNMNKMNNRKKGLEASLGKIY